MLSGKCPCSVVVVLSDMIGATEMDDDAGRVKIGDFMLNVTDRGESDVGLGRYNGLDHIGIHTSASPDTPR